MNQTISRINDQIDRECPVCQNEFILPVSLPGCEHTFCFLCVKGVSVRNMGCPICRGPIDENVLETRYRSLDLKMPLPESTESAAGSNLVAGGSNKLKEGLEDVEELDGECSEKRETPKPIFFWLYEARHNGWWRFDPRTERDIEEANEKSLPATEVLICGSRYVIDFKKMIQYRKDLGFNTKRDIKRVDTVEFDTLNVKGVAGVREE